MAAPETSCTSQIFLTWLIPHSLRHFTAENWQCIVVGLSKGLFLPAQGLLWCHSREYHQEPAQYPYHVQPERNYGEILSLSFTWADGSMASSTVVLRRSCRISRQLPIAMANLEIDSYLGLLSLPNSLPVADWAIGLNSSLAFSSFVYPHPCCDSWWVDYTFPHYDFSTWPSDLVWPGDSCEQDKSRSLKYSLLGFSHPQCGEAFTCFPFNSGPRMSHMKQNYPNWPQMIQRYMSKK